MQMVYLDAAAIGFADDSQSFATPVTDGAYHTVQIEVDAAETMTVSFDGVARLTRAGFTTNGTLAIADQTTDANVDAALRVRSVTRDCDAP